jgi:tRNA-dihydrouridine synthase
VDGVLVGRGAIGNPWLFSGIEKADLEFNDIRLKIWEHLSLMIEFYGDQALILFRKHLVRYLAGTNGTEKLKNMLLSETNVDRYREILESYEPSRELAQTTMQQLSITCESYREGAII